MYDFSKQISKFHDDHVRLTLQHQADMKGRRDANVRRIEDGLQELDKPPLAETIPQGGYKQKSMTQPPESDKDSRYDIDLGVVFEEEDTKGPRTTKGWVLSAIARKAEGLMKNAPEAKPKCVRVIYANGYQCDFAVMRRRWNGAQYVYELAAGDEWVATDPRAMNAWVDAEVKRKSPEEVGSSQARREVRLGKFFCKTHAHRKSAKFPAGLVTTAIFLEHYVAIPGRDDDSFQETLRSISYRHPEQPVIANGQQISDEKDVKRIERLVAQAKKAVAVLDAVGDDSTEEEVAIAWKKVFHHSFFDEVAVSANSAKALETKSAFGGVALASPHVAAKPAAAELSATERLERMRSDVDSQRGSSTGAPWSR